MNIKTKEIEEFETTLPWVLGNLHDWELEAIETFLREKLGLVRREALEELNKYRCGEHKKLKDKLKEQI